MTDYYYLLMFLDKNTVMPESSQIELTEYCMRKWWKEARHIMDEYYNMPLDEQDKTKCKYLLQKATGIRWDNTMDGHGWYNDEESILD